MTGVQTCALPICTGKTLASVEILDPATGNWAAAAPMSRGRANHTATLLPDGRVLVVAGYTTDQGSLAYTRTAEIYDPHTGSWTATAGAPLADRGGHTATTIPDGRILFAGGVRGAARVAELYDPATGLFARTTGDPLDDRVFHAAALTANGTVLLAGGGPGRVEAFVPETGTFSDAGSCPPFGPVNADTQLFATLTPIPGKGRVVLIGGLAEGAGDAGADLVLGQVQVWSQQAGSGTGNFFPMVFDLDVPRAGHTVTPLGSGKFLIVGGFGTEGVVNEARSTIFTPSQ